MAITRRSAAFGLASGGLALAAGGRFVGRAGTARAAEPMKFMTLAGHYYMPPLFAADAGLFARHGLDMQVTIATAPPTVLPAVVGGSLQFGSTSAIQVAMSHQAGLDIVVVAGANMQPREHPATAVLVGPKSGIAAPADFIGKRVITPGTSGSFHVMFLKYLRDHGVDATRVQFVESGFGQMADMVRNGSADAALATEPFLTRAVDAGAGHRIEYFVSDRDYLFDSFFVATRSWIAGHGAELAAVRAALRDAVTEMNANPVHAQAVEAKYLNLPPEVVAKLVWPPYRSEVSAADIQFWVDLSQEFGLVTDKVDARELIAA
jgi:NitT/TauT family transport system substrate-binding protein